MKKVYQNMFALFTAGIIAAMPCYSVAALSQDETVYAKLQTSGEARSIAVTKHLINDAKEAQLQDISVLENIENLNGSESFAMVDGQVVWTANGKDIYYRGTTTKELPVQLEISYFLNGEAKTPDEMLGQEGKVEIRLHYINKARVGDMYVPFVAAIATTLDETQVSNVVVSNGKSTSNGRKIAVAAVATPGLYESLGLEELKGSDTVTVSYETKEFELNDIYTIITPKLIDNDDLKTFAELDQLYDKMNTLSYSSQQLVAGANELATGSKELQTAVNGIAQKLEVPALMIGEDKLTEIKTTAKLAAEQQVEAQRPTITATIKRQVEGNAILSNALKLQATEMCQADLGVNCSAAAIQQYVAKLMAGVEQELVESSMNLAKMTAGQTAVQTAETVALGIIDTMQKSLAPLVKNSLASLTAGVNKLAAGANELSTGMAKFDREGIQPLNNLVNGKIRTTAHQLENLTKLADEYDNYAGIAKGAKGTTKFVLMIEGKKAN